MIIKEIELENFQCYFGRKRFTIEKRFKHHFRSKCSWEK